MYDGHLTAPACRPPATARDETLHWVRCTRTGEFMTWRWRDSLWVTGPMSVFSKSPEWAAANGYRYVSPWLPSFVPTKEESELVSKSMSALRRQNKDQHAEAYKRRKKRFDRITGKQFNRVLGLNKADTPLAAQAAHELRIKGVTYLPLKMRRDGKINKAQYDAAVRYRDEMDIASGISDGSRYNSGDGASSPCDPGGATDRQLHAARLIDHANNVLGRDGRAVVVAINSETALNTVAAILRCSRDTLEERLRVALDMLDRHWSRHAPPASRED